jgi:hypothetical protein
MKKTHPRNKTEKQSSTARSKMAEEDARQMNL